MFYFAWADKTDTTFDSGVHAREDEELFNVSVQHVEGDFPAFVVDIINPRIGLLTSTRKQWAWLSYRKQDNTVVPLAFARLVGVPEQLQDNIIRLNFVARPADYEEQRESLAATLRVAPYYDELWLSNEERVDPDAVLEGRSALWHIDPVTHVVTTSNIITGEDGVVEFTDAEVFYDSVSVTFSESPARRALVDAEVQWSQNGAGTVDITQKLLDAFDTAGTLESIAGDIRPSGGVINIFGGDELVSSWPKFGASIGGGWSVGESFATVVGDAPSNSIAIGNLKEVNFYRTWTQSPYIGQIARELFDGTPGVMLAFEDGSESVWSSFGYVGHGPLNIIWVPIWQIAVTMSLQWETERKRTERVTFEVPADVQPILTDAGEEETLRLSIGPADVDSAIGDARRNRFFSTDRGKQAFEALLARARAHLLARARAVDVTFEVPFESALGLSLRKSAGFFDPRLPGGVVAGKVKSFTLSADGDTGALVASITIGATVGRNGTITAIPGTPTYVEEGYVDGYQVHSGSLSVPIAGDLGYGGLDDYELDDDGVNLFAINARNYLTSLTVSGTVDHTLAEMKGSTLHEQNWLPGLGNVGPVHYTAGSVMKRISEIKTKVSLTTRKVTGGPFETNIVPTVTALKVPRTIDLEASALPALLAGSINPNPALTGALEVGAALLAGSLDADPELTGALTIVESLAGSLDADPELTGDLVTGNLMGGSIDADPLLSGDIEVDGTVEFAGMVAFETPGQSVAGDLLVEGDLAGSIDSSPALTGALTIVQNFAGDIDPNPALVGGLTVEADLAGTIAPTPTLTGAVDVSQIFAGNVDSNPALTGAVAIEGNLAGTIAPTPTLTGSISIGSDLEGSINPNPSLTGGLTVEGNLAGTVNSNPALTGALTIEANLAGTVAPTPTLTGDVATYAALAGTIAPTPTLTGDVQTAQLLAGNVDPNPALTGNVNIYATLAGTIAPTPTLTGAVDVSQIFAGSINSDPALTGNVMTGNLMAGSIDPNPALTGALTIVQNFAGNVDSNPALTGALTIVQNFAGAVHLSTVTGAAPIVTRSSPKWAQNAAGTWTQFAANTLAKTDKGLYVEPTNSAPTLNQWNKYTGGEVGVIGAGGVLPNFMSWSTAGTGLVREIVNFDDVDGLPGMTIRLSGSNTTAAAIFPDIQFLTRTPHASDIDVVPGDVMSFRLLSAQRVAGSDVNFTNTAGRSIGLAEISAAGAYLGEGSGGAAITNVKGPRTATRTIAFATATNFSPYISFAMPSLAGPVDITIQIGLMEVRKQAAIITDSPVLTEGTTGTRAADAVVLPFPPGTHTVTVTFDDNSTQVLTGQSGGDWTIPTNLNRPYIKSVVLADAKGSWDFINNVYSVPNKVLGGALSVVPVQEFAGSIDFQPKSGSFPSFSRSTVKWARNTSGVWTQFAVNAPALTANGILLEPAATNSFANAENMGAEFSTTSNATVAQDAVDPVGTPNKATTVTDSDAVNLGRRQRNVAAGNTDLRTTSMFFKKTVGTPTTYPCFMLLFTVTGTTQINESVVLNTTTGTLKRTTGGQSGTTLGGNAVVTDEGDFWRVAITVQNNGTGNTIGATQIFPAWNDTGTTPSLPTKTGSVVCAWPQYEVGSKATSPILTPTMGATRAADVLTLPFPAGLQDVTITFDDNSTQTLLGEAGGAWVVPTNLNRPVIKSIALANGNGLWDFVNGTYTTPNTVLNGDVEIAHRLAGSIDPNPALTGALTTTLTSIAADWLVVGGGGGGLASGGGGGGVLESAVLGQDTLSLATIAPSYEIVVGAAGVSMPIGSPTNGGNSSFNGHTAIGGARGVSNGVGIVGGSGSGGARQSSPPTSDLGGAGTSGQGNSGGSGNISGVNFGMGGGGGAGAAGGNGAAPTGGNGGAGKSNSITGTAIFYGAGGGGWGTTTRGTGGSSTGGNAIHNSAQNNLNGPSVANSGAGAGGAGGSVSSMSPAAAGRVVVRYTSPTALFSGGTITTGVGGTDVVHDFTAVGSSWLIPLSNVISVDYLVVGAGGPAGNGGGGGGDVLAGSTTINAGGPVYPITVGVFGVYADTLAGDPSTFNGVTAEGGGAGRTGGVGRGASDGAANGGGGGFSFAGGAGDTGGYTGGTGAANAGGGGAGDSAIGGNAASGVGGNGGQGTSSSITGTAEVYGSGGGGTGTTSVGTSGTNAGTATQTSPTTVLDGASMAPPFFGGGSGGRAGANGVQGGTGRVIVRYEGPQRFVGGYVYTDGADVIHDFRADGALKPITSLPAVGSTMTSTFCGAYSAAPGTISHNFAASNLGTAHASRVIILAISSLISGAGTMSVTIGGVTATLIQDSILGSGQVSFWRAAVPTGATGDIIVTRSGGTFTAIQIGVWDTRNAASFTPVDTAYTDLSGAPIEGRLTSISGTRGGYCFTLVRAPNTASAFDLAPFFIAGPYVEGDVGTLHTTSTRHLHSIFGAFQTNGLADEPVGFHMVGQSLGNMFSITLA